MASVVELFSPVADEIEQSARIFRDELRDERPYIRELCEHVERIRGKQLRPALVLLSGQACGGIGPDHRVLAAVVEMVHLATLIHDDVLDEADMRRRVATVSRRWGTESAVLLGDYLISHAFRLCSSLDDQFASQLIGRTAVELCAGELTQVGNSGNFAIDEAEYYRIIEAKTASLIGSCCLLGARYAGADEPTVARLREFGIGLGVAFQIIDDLLDLVGDEQEVGKSLGRDVDMGKLTLPLIHHLRSGNGVQREATLELLGDGASDRCRRIVDQLARTDSVEYARQTAERHVRRSLDILEELPPSTARDSLAALAEFILARRQ